VNGADYLYEPLSLSATYWSGTVVVWTRDRVEMFSRGGILRAGRTWRGVRCGLASLAFTALQAKMPTHQSLHNTA
jgi:hypothetical protein